MNTDGTKALHSDEIVRRAMALQRSGGDVSALSRWISERVETLTLPGVKQYGELLLEDTIAGRREREHVSARLTTAESYFYRDKGQFDLLATTILPELIERRSDRRRLRLWSAGCAAGEEAYSLAMLVDEFSPSLAGWDVHILGTDINSDNLKKAMRGLYGEWSFRALDAERKRRYFQPSGKQWQIDARLRDRVTFRNCDLVRDVFPDADAGLNEFDLILCRNVFIYLDSRAVSRIVAKFAATLADGGCLITGHNELFGHDVAPLCMRMFAQSAVYQNTPPSAAEKGKAEAALEALAMMQAQDVPVMRPPHRIVELIAASNLQQSVPSQLASTPVQDCDQLMLQAWRHADRGMAEEAQEYCRRAMMIATLDPRPYFLLAQLAEERGDQAEATALLAKVLYLDPSFIAAYLELGGLYAQNDDNTRARRMYETACKELRKLPAQTLVAPYSESTAADILAYVERLLADPAAGAENDAGGMVGRSRYAEELRIASARIILHEHLLIPRG